MKIAFFIIKIKIYIYIIPQYSPVLDISKY